MAKTCNCPSGSPSGHSLSSTCRPAVQQCPGRDPQAELEIFGLLALGARSDQFALSYAGPRPVM